MTTTITVVDSSWSTLLRPDWLECLRQTKFLTRCRNGEASVQELHEFVRQQYFYSRHFTRYLNCLLGNLSDETDRTALMANLFEEMGMTGGVSHAQIYRRMMTSMLGTDLPLRTLPATQLLIDTMLDCCRNPRFMVGLGAICLGAEAIVPEIYSAIVNGFEAINEPRENLEFFLIHIGCDDEHAATMRAIIEREVERDPTARLDMEYGAIRALSARMTFFEAISSSCAAAAA